MRYSMLVADDEAPIRKGLIARLRYLDFKPYAVYEACDGADALERIQRHQPDIVITDIRMPVLDGLEFIRQARAAAPATEFVILSGYTEFAYAKQAINLGVHAYLVKPLSNEALAQVMRALLEKLVHQARVREVLERREDADWLLEKQVYDRLTGAQGAEACPCLARFMRPGGWYMLALLDLDTSPGSHTEAARQAVLTCFQEWDAEGVLMTGNPADPGQMFFLLRDGAPERMRALAKRLLRRLDTALRGNGISRAPTVGVSDPAAALSGQLLRQAREALYRRMTHGAGQTYWYADLPRLEEGCLSRDKLALLRRRMACQDLEGVETLLREWFDQAKKQAMPPAFFRFLWMRTVNLLWEVSGGPVSDSMERMMLDLGDLKRFDTVEILCDELLDRIAGILAGGLDDDLDGAAKVQRALQYIGEHYRQSLSVNELAALYGLSPNYFSTLFRRETGVNVTNHIRTVRMDKACALLRGTDDSVVDIAAHVGYADSQYFFRLFRKELGLSPLQYRKKSRSDPAAVK